MAQRGFDDEMIGLIFKFGKKRALKNANSILIGKKQTPLLKEYKKSIEQEIIEQVQLLKSLKRLKDDYKNSLNWLFY